MDNPCLYYQCEVEQSGDGWQHPESDGVSSGYHLVL